MYSNFTVRYPSTLKKNDILNAIKNTPINTYPIGVRKYDLNSFFITAHIILLLLL